MPTITWDDSWVLGIAPFDDHHKHLVSLINETYDLFVAGKDTELKGVLDELVKYAIYHFAAEEAWMREIRYPKQEEHSLEHEEFSRKIIDFHHRFIMGRSLLTLEVLSFLKRWLENHIKKKDGAYRAFHAA